MLVGWVVQNSCPAWFHPCGVVCAGLLVSLCSDDAKKEQIAKGKTSGANGSSCCQVLHGCLANPSTAPRHVINLLAILASHPVVG